MNDLEKAREISKASKDAANAPTELEEMLVKNPQQFQN